MFLTLVQKRLCHRNVFLIVTFHWKGLFWTARCHWETRVNQENYVRAADKWKKKKGFSNWEPRRSDIERKWILWPRVISCWKRLRTDFYVNRKLICCRIPKLTLTTRGWRSAQDIRIKGSESSLAICVLVRSYHKKILPDRGLVNWSTIPRRSMTRASRTLWSHVQSSSRESSRSHPGSK